MPAFRSPYDTLLGLVFLPRLLDKMRVAGTSALDGYNYKTTGMDASLLQFLDVDADAMESVVTSGASDPEMAAWLVRHARPWTREEAIAFNHAILDRGQRSEEERSNFEARRLERYPNAALEYYVDLIEADAGRPIRKRPLPPACYDPPELSDMRLENR